MPFRDIFWKYPQKTKFPFLLNELALCLHIIGKFCLLFYATLFMHHAYFVSWYHVHEVNHDPKKKLDSADKKIFRKLISWFSIMLITCAAQFCWGHLAFLRRRLVFLLGGSLKNKARFTQTTPIIPLPSYGPGSYVFLWCVRKLMMMMYHMCGDRDFACVICDSGRRIEGKVIVSVHG